MPRILKYVKKPFTALGSSFLKDLILDLTALSYPPPTVTKDSITGNINNYNLGEGETFRLSSTTSVIITGFHGGIDGRKTTVINVGSNQISFDPQSSSSISNNRFIILNGTLDIAIGGIAEFVYDGTTQRWRLKSYNGSVSFS